MPVMELDSVRQTTLWKRLDSGFEGVGGQMAKGLAGNLVNICSEAAERMKAMPKLHPEYTLHDSTHLLGVTDLMARIIPDDALRKLNPVELALLILAAHFHDVGMVPDASELEVLREDSSFRLFRSNWALRHPSLREVDEHLKKGHLDDQEYERCVAVKQELEGALVSDYVRSGHGERSARIVRERFGKDPRWEIGGTNIAHLVGVLCASHVMPVANLRPEHGLRHNQVIARYEVNVPYLAVILRLADILDFDHDRAPDFLYCAIHFTNQLSLKEWAKHRSVKGRVISADRICFSVSCEGPEYQKEVNNYMDRIDGELRACHQLVKDLPGPFAHCLALPQETDRSQIETNGTYKYRDLAFTLSRDEIVKLLMGEQLYEDKAVCIRELLQNALDAVRHRRAIFKRDSGTEWTEGQVAVEHFVDSDGTEVVCCSDNGTGMDEDIVANFLTRVGRSYYRSPEFEQERESFRLRGADFEPCSQFGIGFLSCFMLGDRIRVHTRRDYGGRRGQGAPLMVEINGVAGMLVIRDGSDRQPGTTVEIVVRREPSHERSLRVADTVKEYAVCPDFPIEVRSAVQGEHFTIPSGVPDIKTLLEETVACVTLSQDLAAVSSQLKGYVKLSIPVDDRGDITTEAGRVRLTPGQPEWMFASDAEAGEGYDSEETPEPHRRGGAICVDGILVGSSDLIAEHNPGRVIVVDVRGPEKPPLPVSRYLSDMTLWKSSWQLLIENVRAACGLLWERFSQEYRTRMDWASFWRLACAYSPSVLQMRKRAIWNLLIPTRSVDGILDWREISSLGLVRPSLPQSRGRYILHDKDGLMVDMQSLRVKDKDDLVVPEDPLQLVTTAIESVSSLTLVDGAPWLQPTFPEDPDVRLSELGACVCMPFLKELDGCLSANIGRFTSYVNRRHPLAALALAAQGTASSSRLVELASDLAYSTFAAGSVYESKARRDVGLSYQSVDWSEQPPAVLPPYRIWLKGAGIVELSDRELRQWAEIKAPRWD